MSSNGTTPDKLPLTILAVRLGSMGDVIHTLPAVALLKRGFPQADVTWAIESRWAPLLAENPFVDRVLSLPIAAWKKRPLSAETRAEFRDARRQLRNARFDLAVDFQGLLKSAMVTFFSRADRVFGFGRAEAREPLAASFYSNRIDTGATHFVEKCLRLALSAGARAPASEGHPVFAVPQGRPEASLPDGPFVLASPAAGWKAKQWPEEYYVELAGRIWRDAGMPMVVDCSPNNAEAARGIVSAGPSGSCLLHESSIPGLIAATRRAYAVVGVDSGPLHLAAALGRPGVAIFGPTDPLRNGPFGESFHVLRDASARTSYKRADEVDPSMSAVRPGQVWDALKPLLAPRPAPPNSGEPAGRPQVVKKK